MYTGPKLINDNLVFGYDTGYGVADNVTPTKFYKGAPTTNPIHGQNAVAQDSYTTWSATSSGNWNANHPKAIRAYNAGGGDITGYYNGGVGDATNTHHAHWQLDPILKKPVVVMNDRGDANWKAKSYGTGLGTWTSQGKTYGDTYTISWLQWVDDLSKNARTGLYTQTTSGSNGFHDGQSTSASSYNTKLRTWQRVYQTYTTANSRNLNHSMASIYMYGHYSPRAVVKVADVQWQWGSTPFPFSETSERSNTQSLIDLTKSTDITLSAMTYDSTGQPDYDGTDDYINLGDYAPIRLGTNFTIEFVVRPEEDKWMYFFHKGYGSNNSLAWGRHSSGDDWFFSTMIGGSYQNSYMGTATLNKYCHLVATYDGANLRLYENGVLKVTSAKTHDMLTSSASAGIGGPDRYWNGKIPVTKIYSKVLTTEEVVSNFKTYKNRFNI